MKVYLTHIIEEERDEKGLKAAQELYRILFIRTRAYKRHKEVVDSNLQIDGYCDCVVEE